MSFISFKLTLKFVKKRSFKFFFLIRSKSLPAILVSSQAITSASNKALYYLIDISFKFPIGVGHTISFPFLNYGFPISMYSLVLNYSEQKKYLKTL